ncbi:hypothetical protein ACOMHN_043959 [Nucella lapillus]
MRRQCPRGFFGYQCIFRCRCYANDECNKVTGTCPRGCASGYWGPGCQLSNRCYYNGQKRNYMGTINQTKDGTACQDWGSQHPHEHRYTPADFPDGSYPENYCRTTADASKPWCYGRSVQKRWGYCDTINCACPAGLFGHNCAKMCHCKNQKEKCDSMLGRCQSGCDKGWTGFDCQTPARCEANTYGWACESQCKCRSDRHCNRFTGPTPECQCRDGFFNPPDCEPVTKPRIVEFTIDKVNPGQPATFNCTVSAFPTPEAKEISLQVPDGRKVTIKRSVELPNYGYTRKNTFQVAYVHSGEQYKCVVKATAGNTQMVIYSEVFELPRLNDPPGVVHGTITAENATVEWRRWNPERGDPGDPKILWYSVYMRASGKPRYEVAGTVFHTFCREKCRFVLTKLNPNTRYSVYVSVMRDGEGGEGPAGPVIHLTTKCSAPTLPPDIDKLSPSLQHNASHPQTRLVVTWNAPSRNSIHCNHIAKYVLRLAPPPEKGPARTWNMPASSSRMISIPGLLPFTQYCATITFRTDGGFQSPRSPKQCVVTPQTTPPAPTNLREVRTGSSSVRVAWRRPDPPRGNISLYRVMYWQLNSTGATGLEWRTQARAVEYKLTGLEPLTTYQIQVQAVNEAGTGEASAVLTVTTEEDIPGKVRRIRNVTRTERTIELQWGAPDSSGGKILHYTVECDPRRTLLGSKAAVYREHRLGAGSEGHVVQGLSPATQYLCSVRAHTARGPGPPATVVVWTLAGGSQRDEDVRPRATVGVFPTFLEKASSMSMQKHAMQVVMKATEFVNPGQIPVIVGDCPLYVQQKKCQMAYSDEVGEKHIVCMIGFLHVEMASQECGGKLLAASGWERMFSMANIFSSGVTASLLGGKHVKRTRYAYHLTLALLHVLKLRAYKEYCTGYGPHEPTDVWEQRLIDASPTISYWTTVREYLLINCHFVKGQRQGDWPLTLSACENLCSWFFVFGHTNYARWLPVFLQNMARLPDLHPSVHAEFMEGNFVVQRSEKKFSMMGLDQSQEHSIQFLKEDSGPKGLYGQEEEKEMIELSKPEVLRIVHEFQNACFKETTKRSTEHPEASSAEQSKFLKHLKALVSLIDEDRVVNPFTEQGPELVTLDTGEVMDPAIADGLKEAKSIGKKCKLSL